MEWLLREGRWAITQQLANTPSLEETTQQVATATLPRLLERGYQVARSVLEAMVYSQVARRAVVLRVEEPDGTFRPLDERTLRLLQQMAYHRRVRSARDWIAAMDALDYEAKRSRERQEEALWSSLARDKVFTRILKDTVSGLKMRHTVGGPLPESSAAA